jgi:hypothetical protein
VGRTYIESEKKVLCTVFQPERAGVVGDWEKLYNEVVYM